MSGWEALNESTDWQFGTLRGTQTLKALTRGDLLCKQWERPQSLPKTPHPPSPASPPTSLLTPICGSKKYVPRPLPPPPVTLAEVELSCSLALHRPVSQRAEDPTHLGGFNRKRSALDPTMIFIYFYWDVVAVQGWICSRFIAKRLSYRYLCIYTPVFILFSHVDYFRSLHRPPVLYSRSLLVIPLYRVVCMCQPHPPNSF